MQGIHVTLALVSASKMFFFSVFFNVSFVTKKNSELIYDRLFSDMSQNDINLSVESNTSRKVFADNEGVSLNGSSTEIPYYFKQSQNVLKEENILHSICFMAKFL